MAEDVPDREGGPTALGDVLAARVEAIRERQAELPPPQLRSNTVESEEERESRLDRQSGRRRERWQQRLPKLYQSATLDALDSSQHPKELTGWLARGQSTLFLAGAPGTGKTFAAYALGSAAAARRMWVEAWNTVELLEALLPSAGSPETWSAVLECDLLILDDLAAPKVTDWASQAVYRIADKRVNEERRQVVTTNGSFEELVEKWGAPTMDRLVFGSASLVMTGPSRRKSVGW